MHVKGSMELVRKLIEHDLVDEYWLMIDPLGRGGGKHIFPGDGVLRPLRSVKSQVTTTGPILLTYIRLRRKPGGTLMKTSADASAWGEMDC